MSMPPIGPNKDVNPFEGVRASAKESSPLPQPQDNPIVRFVKSIFQKIGRLFSSNKDNVSNVKAKPVKHAESSGLITKIRQFIGSRLFYDRTEAGISASILARETERLEQELKKVDQELKNVEQKLFYEQIEDPKEGVTAVKNSLNEIGLDVSLDTLEFEGEKIEVPHQFKVDSHRSRYSVNGKEVKFFADEFPKDQIKAFKDFEASLDDEVRVKAINVLNQSLLADVYRHLIVKLNQSGKEAFGINDIEHFAVDPPDKKTKTTYEIENTDSELKLTVLYPVKVTAYTRGQSDGDLAPAASLYCNIKREVTIPKLPSGKINTESPRVVDTYSNLMPAPGGSYVPAEINENSLKEILVPEIFKVDMLRSSHVIYNGEDKINIIQNKDKEISSGFYIDVLKDLGSEGFNLVTDLLNQAMFNDMLPQIKAKFDKRFDENKLNYTMDASQPLDGERIYEIHNSDSELRFSGKTLVKLLPVDEGKSHVEGATTLYCAIKREYIVPKNEKGELDVLNMKIVDIYSKYRRLPEEALAYIKYA